MRMHAPLLALLILAAGCQPMMFPMVIRLPPERQQEIDASWTNMLTPVDRLDRQTLLDCMIFHGLYQLGVDELHLKSIKKTPRGRVEMTIDFDKARPKADRFTLKVIGSWGRVLRSESWTGDEVFAALPINVKTGERMEPAEAQEQAFHRRMERLTAATQPAGP